MNIAKLLLADASVAAILAGGTTKMATIMVEGVPFRVERDADGIRADGYLHEKGRTSVALCVYFEATPVEVLTFASPDYALVGEMEQTANEGTSVGNTLGLEANRLPKAFAGLADRTIASQSVTTGGGIAQIDLTLA